MKDTNKSKNKLDLSEARVGMRVKLRNGQEHTITHIVPYSGTYPYKLSNGEYYTKTGQFYYTVKKAAMDIVEIIKTKKQMKPKIDLSKLKIGDKVKLRKGVTLILHKIDETDDIYPYQLSNAVWYTGTGHYLRSKRQSELDIVEIVKSKKQENTFDFTALPKGCTEIVIDGVKYKKKEKIVITWEKE